MKSPFEMKPGNRYAKERGFGRSLGGLVTESLDLVAICPRCKHQSAMHLPALIQRFGEACLVMQLRSKLRCSACHARSPNLHERPQKGETP